MPTPDRSSILPAALNVSFWSAAVLVTGVCFFLVRALGIGWDSHAYYEAWQGPMYDHAPNTLDAYLYSPAFAQAIRPLALLPWPLFAAVFLIAPAAAFAWLLAPMGWLRGVPAWLCCLPEILAGNIYWLLALVAYAGLRSGAWWAIPALTKVTPALGPIWFAVRGEWRSVLVAVSATAAVVAVSVVLAPDLWADWLHLLRTNAQPDEGIGAELAPPLAIRLPIGLALVVWGARTNRPWTIPVAMAAVTPVIALASLTVMAAIPRLNRTPA